MTSTGTPTEAAVQRYIAEQEPDKRDIIEAARTAIRANIAPEFEEGMQYGMLGYYLPHSYYPDGYHARPSEPLPFTGLGAQKRHVGLYLFCIYTDTHIKSWFEQAWRDTGMRLDMGKSCVRVRRLSELPVDVIAELFGRVSAADFVAAYERAIPARRR